MIESGVGGMESEGVEGLKTSGLVLYRTQTKHVIDAILFVLNVTIEHGGVGGRAGFVRGARSLQPFIAIDLVVADNMADPVGENLSAPAWQRVYACFFHPYQGLRNRQLGAARQVGHLDHGEGFDVNLREAHFQSGYEVEA